MQQNGQHYGEAANKLATTTIGLPQDHEWSDYVSRDSTFAGTGMSLRALEEIDYPGCKHPTTVEIRSGQLERRTKYLKSYTPGW